MRLLREQSKNISDTTEIYEGRSPYIMKLGYSIAVHLTDNRRNLDRKNDYRLILDAEDIGLIVSAYAESVSDLRSKNASGEDFISRDDLRSEIGELRARLAKLRDYTQQHCGSVPDWAQDEED